MPLPIDAVLPDLREALRRSSRVVLQAPPGAGKTTRVPIAALDERWVDGTMLILEPRRLAARAAAGWLARGRGEAPGQTIGYRIRLDTRVGPRTRIEFVTEGVLTRRLLDDPGLDGVGLVIFDEFHERNLDADLALALTLQAQTLLRADLRILVMSATIDADAIAATLGGAPVVRSEGRSWPVETIFAPPRQGLTMEGAAAGAARRALESDGDVLVFLPGAGEIRRAESLLLENTPRDTDILPLHGLLDPETQERAIAPSPPGRRKVVLATSIAETSLTIEGVRTVIDSGWERVPRYSPRTGMSALETVRVSRASADQRRGRAGRLGPGRCYRLWSEGEDAGLAARRAPEIMAADLTGLALDLAAAGVPDPGVLTWMDPPPAAALESARAVLRSIEALDGAGRVTDHGRALAGLALHPRLAHMVLRAREIGLGALACDLAALLSERDIVRSDGGGVPDADLRLRVETLREERGRARSPDGPGIRVDRGAVERARDLARRWRVQVGIPGSEPVDVERCGAALAFAWPERIAQRRATAGRFVLRNGRGVAFPPHESQTLATAAYLVVAAADDRAADGRIFLAAPIDGDEIELLFADAIQRAAVVAWNDAAKAVEAVHRESLGAIVLREAPLRDADPGAVSRALMRGVARLGLDALPWDAEARAVRRRIAFARSLDPSWPDLSDEALMATLDGWLAPYVPGVTRAVELRRVDLARILLARLRPDQRRMLDEIAPTHLTVPSGSRIAIDYSDPAAPVLAVRIQELFGLGETPRVGRGTVPLTLHLLSPSQRPVQVTRDLAGFWRSAYFEVRKDLRGRYPKHHWPDDPMAAEPTRRARPRT